eukprot:scaffold3521_cov209-Prasinococcus_capsulatus_cf.AAC.1
MVVYCSQAFLPSPLTHSSTDVRPSSATKSARHLHLHSLAGCATRSTVLRRWGPRTPMHILASGGQPTPAHSPQSAAHKSEPSEQRTNGARSKGGKVLQLDDVGFYGAVEDVRAKDQAKLNVWSDGKDKCEYIARARLEISLLRQHSLVSPLVPARYPRPPQGVLAVWLGANAPWYVDVTTHSAHTGGGGASSG